MSSASIKPAPLVTELTAVQRRYLCDWPVGESRRHLFRRYRFVQQGANEALADWQMPCDDPAFNRQQIEGLVGERVLTTTTARTKFDVVLERLDRPIPRPVQRTSGKRTYKGIFPWSVEAHWKRVSTAPARATAEVLAQLSGDTDHPYYNPTKARLAPHIRYPIFVHTKSELADARRALLWTFELPMSKRRARGFWLPKVFHSILHTGEQLQILLLNLLIEPVFAQGKCTGFRALDGEAAAEELERLGGKSGDPIVKYLQYLNGQTTP